MSKTDDLLACQHPFGREYESEIVGEPARYGSGYHAVMAHALSVGRTKKAIAAASRKYSIDVEELSDHFSATAPILQRWLAGDNPYKIDFTKGTLSVEQSLAYEVVSSGKTRVIAAPTEDTHEYRDAKETELPGTLDLKVIVGDVVLVIDHKTGGDIDAPLESGQLLSQGLAAASDERKVIVGFFHVPRGLRGGGVYSDVVEPAMLQEHRSRLKRAFSRIGEEAVSPGPWCAYCPALTTCKAKTSTLVELRKKPGETLTRERVGSIHQALNEYDALAKKLKAEVRRWVEAHGEAVRPDGKIVAIEERNFTELSMTSIREALGEVEGARMIEKLEKLGCVKRGTRPELRAGRAE